VTWRDRSSLAARPDHDWISLGPAARLLGVDPATLGRWATSGRVDAFITPGGHRRFSRVAIERLRDEQAAGRLSLGASKQRIAAAYQRRYGGNRPPLPRPWLAGLSETDRDGFRARGRRMVDAILVNLDAADGAARTTSLRSAERLGREYGAEARRLNLPLAETIAAFLGSRAPLLAEIANLASRRHLTATSTGRLFTQAAALLDDILLTLVDEYERPARGAGPAVSPGGHGADGLGQAVSPGGPMSGRDARPASPVGQP